MFYLVGSSRLVGDVETGLAQTIEQRLKLWPQRFWIEGGMSSKHGIRAKVRFNFQQLVESIGSINGVLILLALQSPVNNAPAHAGATGRAAEI